MPVFKMTRKTHLQTSTLPIACVVGADNMLNANHLFSHQIHTAARREVILLSPIKDEAIDMQRNYKWGWGVTSTPQFPGLRIFLCTNHFQQCQ